MIALGHHPRLITSHPTPTRRSVEDELPIARHWRPPQLPLTRRGYQEHLTHLPFSYLDLRRGDDDLAQAFYPTDALAAVRWARRCRRPAVFHYGGIPQRNVIASRRLRLRVVVEALYGADAVIVDSAAAARAMWRWFGLQPRVINPGVRLERFRPVSERSPSPTIVCAADPADARKRVPLLVRAFGLVRKTRRDARLILVRPREAALERTLSGEGVSFFDPDPDAVGELFARAWVTALAAYNEAFGLVLVESLACGTPVVAMRDGGIPEIVDRPEVGVLFEEASEDALARALLDGLELGEDPDTARRCRARAAEFSASRCADEHVRLWRELLSR